MEDTYYFKSIGDIINFGINQRDYWFRGHSQIYNALAPSVHRGKYSEFISIKKLYPEKFFYERFKRYAPSIAKDLPKEKNYIEWLCLMQHHGLPTRLLDWTQNILVAVFFSVSDRKDKDGEVFVLDPMELNKQYEIKFPSYNNSVLNYIASEPFNNEDSKTTDKLHPKPKTPLAFLPNLSNQRLSAQKGTFTIHPNNDEKHSIQNLVKSKNSLFRFIIPSKNKHNIYLELHNLGINFSSLFPDLDGLSKFLMRDFDFFGAGTYKPDMKRFV